MNIREYRPNDLHRLFDYWTKLGADIPYFFPVSALRWQSCLLEDELDGGQLFRSLETYLATEGNQVLGFVQWGQPNFAWDSDDQRYENPSLGVIRHLYYEPGRPDVGHALLDKATGDVARFDRLHAFYHILGMSCNAHHGKLHSSQAHVEELLLAHGFRIEHENVYYVLDLGHQDGAVDSRLHISTGQGSAGEMFEARLDGKVVCTARVRSLDRLTGGQATGTAYLTWLGVAEQHRGLGIGNEFLSQLVRLLLSRHVRCLHTDTAIGNVQAQRLYEKLGFRNQGFTRSYVRD